VTYCVVSELGEGTTLKDMEIIPMQASHLAAVGPLLVQLGYEVRGADLARRFPALSADPNQLLLVAADHGKVIGWGQGQIESTLIVGRRLVIAGLVVEEKYRSKGAGAALLTALELWGKDHGCEGVRVSSRLTRERAHVFYDRNGYTREKVSQIFKKDFSASP